MSTFSGVGSLGTPLGDLGHTIAILGMVVSLAMNVVIMVVAWRLWTWVNEREQMTMDRLRTLEHLHLTEIATRKETTP